MESRSVRHASDFSDPCHTPRFTFLMVVGAIGRGVFASGWEGEAAPSTAYSEVDGLHRPLRQFSLFFAGRSLPNTAPE